MTITRREQWIDILKGVAILAVLIDHVTYLLNESAPRSLLWIHLSFTVLWFIFITGITSIISISKRTLPFFHAAVRFWWRKIPLVLSYIAVTTITYIYYTYPNSSLSVLWAVIIWFNAMPPYYFFFIIFQLYLLFPLLYLLVRKFTSLIGLIVIGIGIYITTIIMIHLGGSWRWVPNNFLLGGGYLPAFFLGVVYEMNRKRFEKIELLFAYPIFLLYETLFLINTASYLDQFPTFYRYAWSLSLLIIIKSVIQQLPSVFNPIKNIFAFLGKHSLIIFLVHWDIYQILIWRFKVVNPIILMAITLTIALLLPISKNLLKKTLPKLSILISR